MSFTCVNVHHVSVGDKLKVFTRQLLRQEDARRHHYDGFGSIRLKLLQGIKDSHVGLTTTRRKHTDAFRMLLKGIQSNLLMRTELNHVLGCVWDYYSRKRGPEEPLVPLMKLD